MVMGVVCSGQAGLVGHLQQHSTGLGDGGLVGPWRGGDRHGSEELLSECYAEGASVQRRLGQCSKPGTFPEGDKRDTSFKSGSRVCEEIPGEGVPCPPTSTSIKLEGIHV